jgi:O-acetylserine/cysteine efflux transporter
MKQDPSGSPRAASSLGFDVADAAMLTVIVIWALSNVLSKTSLAEISPMAFIFARVGMAAPALFAYVAIRQGIPVPDRADWGQFLLAGASGYGLYNLLYIYGIDLSSAFSVALLLSLGPVFTLLLAAVLRIERVTPVQWVGVAVATLGVAVFVSDKLAGGMEYHPLGDLLIVVGAALFAVYSLVTRPLVGKYGAPATTAWSLLVGFAVLAPFAIGPFIRQQWTGLSAAAWIGLLFAAFGSLLVAYNLWAWAIERRGVARTVPYLFVLPVLTGVFSALMTGERFGPRKVLGAALVLGGTAIVRVIGGRLAARSGRRSADAMSAQGDA